MTTLMTTKTRPRSLRRLHSLPDDTPARLFTLPRCPHCGTQQQWCRVWAGGPGHTNGLHPDRVVTILARAESLGAAA